MTTETPQSRALTLTVNEAARCLTKIEQCAFLKEKGIQVYAVDAPEGVTMYDNSVRPGKHIMVRAETDFLVGVGVGFLQHMVEGLA